MKLFFLLFLPLTSFGLDLKNPDPKTTQESNLYAERVVLPMIKSASDEGKTSILIQQVNQNECSLDCVNLIVFEYQKAGYHYSVVLDELTNEVSFGLGWYDLGKKK